MACFGSGETETSKTIEKELEREKKKRSKCMNLLLLGAGESGKSTVAKQMKILHLNGFTDDERKAFREVVYSNIVSSVKALVEGARRFGSAAKSEQAAENVMNLKQVQNLTDQVWEDIKATWKDEALLQVWRDHASELQLLDSAHYFYENLERIAKEGADYVPSVDDILHARQMTTGIVEIEWDANDMHFKMVDVGGQRNHRNKWIHCFDGVTAVLFVVSLSEYDQVLREDESTNRMQESLQLFENLANSEWFWKVPFIIFFNKKDLFEKKIEKVDLKVCFEDYSGGCNAENAKKFVVEKFLDMDQKRSPSRSIYHHFTCATDTNNIEAVFNIVRDVLLKKHLQNVFG